MLLGKAAHFRIDCGHATLQLGDPPFAIRDVALYWSGIKGGNLRRQKIDGRFQLLEALALRCQEADRQIANAFGDMVAKDSERAWKLAEEMESGSVWVNKHADIQPHLPFGGAKFSGVGSELGEEGLKEFTQVQVLNMAR